MSVKVNCDVKVPSAWIMDLSEAPGNAISYILTQF